MSPVGRYLLLPCALFVLLPYSTAMAIGVPVVETFDTGVNHWRDVSGADLDFVSLGAGEGHATTTFNLKDKVGGPVGSREATTVLIRASTTVVPGVGTFASSDGAFFGTWLDGKVDRLSFMVRHTAPEPLHFFARFATPANFPAVAANFPAPVNPNEWTELVVPIDLAGSHWALEGSSPAAALSNVGNLQIGIYTPPSLGGIDQPYSLDLDNVRLLPIPEPATFAVLGVAGLSWLLFRRTSPS